MWQDKLKEIIYILENSNVNEIEINFWGRKFRVVKSPSTVLNNELQKQNAASQPINISSLKDEEVPSSSSDFVEENINDDNGYIEDDIQVYQDDHWSTVSHMNLPRAAHAVSIVNFDDLCKT